MERSSWYVPKQLFHTVLEIVDYSKDASENSRAVYVLRTHGTLEAAKTYAVNSLETLSFTPDDFYQYFARLGKGFDTEGWTKGDGVFVFARTFMTQELHIRIDTTPNQESLPSTIDGQIILPSGVPVLHYVLKVIADCHDLYQNGGRKLTEIQGAFLHREDALMTTYKFIDQNRLIEYNSQCAAHFQTYCNLARTSL